METIQDSWRDGDLTCFLEYYLGMLSRSVTGFDAYIAQKSRDEGKGKELSNAGDNPSATLAISENRQHAPHEDQAQSKQQSLVPNEAEEERDRLLAESSSPEGLVLMIIQELNTDAARHIMEIYRYLHANASRKYSCSELAEILQMKEGTTRRICYVMAT